jgi:alkaline phosphatase D
MTDQPTIGPTIATDRRTLLKSGAAATAVIGTSAALASASVEAEAAGPAFRHGVASGDPLPNHVVLWTRVTPTAASTPGSGRGPQVTVTWEVAHDRAFTRVVNHGRFVTGPSRDHTVKVDAGGLAPATWYYYRFRWDGQSSRIGRTRTAPAHDSTPGRIRLGVVSCANLQAGWFSAYRHLAKRDDLHAVLHLGDYVYEYGPGEYGYGKDNVDVRKHVPGHEMISLADYRQRHAQYKRDQDLQDLHARYPFIATWDDHEVANDAWKKGAENHNAGEGPFLARRARAHRAYDEWMPVRLSSTAKLGDGTRMFRRLRFGRLAELSMLDLRTYRDKQVSAPTGDVSDPDRTITGRAQLDFLKTGLANGRATWKVVGNPVMIAPVTLAQLPADLVDPIDDVTGLLPRDGIAYNVDQWDGYTDDRREVFTHIRQHDVHNVLFLTGDIHSGWASELPHDVATYPLSDSVAVEFVCTSITSNNLDDLTGSPRRTSSLAVEEIIKANNRHVKYLNFDDHGYSVLELTATHAQMDWFIIGDRRNRNAGASWTASYRTYAGSNKVVAVDKPLS